MKVAVLFSGGKDSNFAVFESLKKGRYVKYLVSMLPKNPESYMFHYPNIKWVEKQAEAMKIPVVTRHTDGVKEKELDDLRDALYSIKGRIDAVVAGGLASKYQMGRVGKVCNGLELRVIAPLWGIEPEKYWRMVLKSGFEVIVTAVACEGLGKEWLGKKIDLDVLGELKKLSKKYDFHLAGEGGEFETFILDGPMYKKKIMITDFEKKWKGDCGMFVINEVKMINKKYLKRVLNFYKNRKSEIKRRIEHFKNVWKKSEKRIFSELCFCLFTPQSKAVVCDRAVSKLEKNGMLYKGTAGRIRRYMKGVRFAKTKSERVVTARNDLMKNKKFKIKEKINPRDLKKTREWLKKNIKGLGYKEASHFLRNIGFGRDFAILDRHILKNLKRLGLIEDVPDFLTKKGYMKIEKLMKRFSEEISIPLAELDLVFWGMETGRIFK